MQVSPEKIGTPPEFAHTTTNLLSCLDETAPDRSRIRDEVGARVAEIDFNYEDTDMANIHALWGDTYHNLSRREEFDLSRKILYGGIEEQLDEISYREGESLSELVGRATTEGIDQAIVAMIVRAEYLEQLSKRHPATLTPDVLKSFEDVYVERIAHGLYLANRTRCRQSGGSALAATTPPHAAA